MSERFKVQTHAGEDEIVMRLIGRFDFSQYTYFKEKQSEVLGQQGIQSIVLDMSELQYLDSAALGILLVMLDRSKQEGVTLVLRGAHGVVREILDVAHFDRMFQIED